MSFGFGGPHHGGGHHGGGHHGGGFMPFGPAPYWGADWSPSPSVYIVEKDAEKGTDLDNQFVIAKPALFGDTVNPVVNAPATSPTGALPTSGLPTWLILSGVAVAAWLLLRK